jgi:hypothetical protein
MNEQQFAEGIRRALDESAGRLPYRITHRLETARAAALAHAAAIERRTEAVRRVQAQSDGSATLGGGEQAPWWGAFATLVPVLIVVAGLFAISEWTDVEQAEETADIDLAVLTDELPISAYADRGFGVFLKNNRQ